jgi:hypothetical protein
MCAYSVNTYRTPIIITMNLEEDWETIIENDWVKDNCIAVFAPDAMYVGPDSCSVSEDAPGSWDKTIKAAAAYKNRSNGRKRKLNMGPASGDGSDHANDGVET